MIALIIAATIASVWAILYLDQKVKAFNAPTAISSTGLNALDTPRLTRAETVMLPIAILITFAMIIASVVVSTVLAATIITYAAALFAGVAISKTVAVIAGAAIVINRAIFNVRRERRLKRLEAAVEVKA